MPIARRCAIPAFASGLLLLFTSAALTGCAGASFGSELTATPAPFLIRETQEVTLRLPEETAFSIRLPQSTEQAGLLGSVDAHANVAREGAGTAHADVKNGGKGTATFQLGHLFKNDTPRQLDLTVRVKYTFDYSARNEPRQLLPDATIGLRLYARDGRGRVLRNFDLVHHSTEQGATTRHSGEDLTFDVVLGANESLAVFLAGQSAIDTPEGRSAEAHLEVKNFSMEMRSRPSPAVAPASQPATPRAGGRNERR